MSEKERKKRVNMAKATLAVLEILQKESDENHRLSIQDIRRRMYKEPYCLYATRDTIGIPDKQYTLNAEAQGNISVIHEAIYRQGAVFGREVRITKRNL